MKTLVPCWFCCFYWWFATSIVYGSASMRRGGWRFYVLRRLQQLFFFGGGEAVNNSWSFLHEQNGDRRVQWIPLASPDGPLKPVIERTYMRAVDKNTSAKKSTLTFDLRPERNTQWCWYLLGGPHVECWIFLCSSTMISQRKRCGGGESFVPRALTPNWTDDQEYWNTLPRVLFLILWCAGGKSCWRKWVVFQVKVFGVSRVYWWENDSSVWVGHDGTRAYKIQCLGTMQHAKYLPCYFTAFEKGAK